MYAKDLLVNNGGGAEIEGKINEYRAKFLSLLDENVKADYEDKLTLQVVRLASIGKECFNESNMMSILLTQPS